MYILKYNCEYVVLSKIKTWLLKGDKNAYKHTEMDKHDPCGQEKKKRKILSLAMLIKCTMQRKQHDQPQICVYELITPSAIKVRYGSSL